MISGSANVAQTVRYLQQHYVEMKRLPMFCTSPIAIGTHLGEMNDEDSRLYKEALTYGLRNGINFVDTALNYRGKRSERDIGQVLKKIIVEDQVLKREEIILSTKAGLIPGDIDAKLVPTEYLKQVLLKEKIIQEKDIHVMGTSKHVLEPSYFQFAIEESRRNVHVETLDIYYLHNPEISLEVIGETKFYQKLEKLFQFFEEQVEKEKIRYYGLATWHGFLRNPQDAGYLSLEKVVQTAELVAGEQHHFRFIQFPFNFSMQEGKSLFNQTVSAQKCSLLKAAEMLQIHVTTSAPFNLGKAFDDGMDARQTLRSILENKKVSAVMVGMKRKEHVRENMEAIRRGE